jgi:hypothetical protein
MTTAANQTQIPSIQTPDNSLNQVQQNINKVFRNLNNQLINLSGEVNDLMIIGEVKFAPLTLLQFQAQAGSDWIIANGQSAVGTQYALMFKVNVVPNISVSGLTAFIKVN